jgi:hypothetical protein
MILDEGTMDWRSWIVQGIAQKSQEIETRPVFADGAPPERLEALEGALGVRLPSALREFMAQSDGVKLEMRSQGEWIPFHTEVWSCADIADRNREIRADPDGPTPPEDGDVVPLFFASAGTDGIVFAFFIRRSGGGEDPAIHAYYPVDREWCIISPSLAVHLHGWKV